MKSSLRDLLSSLHNDQAGQGLVEYLLIIAFVAFAVTAGLHSIANGVNSAFTAVGTVIGDYIT